MELTAPDPVTITELNTFAQQQLYLMGRYQESFNDIDPVLKLEKRHFGALKLENYAEALESYQRAQKIYPLINAQSYDSSS